MLIIDETGDRKRGQGIVLAAMQYIGKLGHTANGVVSVTSHWADGTRHVPLGVKPYRPARRLPLGKADPAFRTKPELAWERVEEAREARAAGIPFRVVVADCVYGENLKFESRRLRARIRSVLALRPNRGTWQYVQDPRHPPAVTPAEAAHRLPKRQRQRTVRLDSHGRALGRYVAELELGPAYGPTTGIRLIAATDDPVALKGDSAWFMATTLTCAEADPAEVHRLDSLRNWIEHYYKPAKHELGWADFQVRPERAIVRHWHLVMLAFTLLAGAPPPADASTAPLAATSSAPDQPSGGKSGPRIVWQATLRAVRRWRMWSSTRCKRTPSCRSRSRSILGAPGRLDSPRYPVCPVSARHPCCLARTRGTAGARPGHGCGNPGGARMTSGRSRGGRLVPPGATPR